MAQRITRALLGCAPGVLVTSIRPRKQGTLTRPSCLKHHLGKNTKWGGTSEFHAAVFAQLVAGLEGLHLYLCVRTYVIYM